MSTKHNSKCLENASDTEEIFVLRAQDKCSPIVVLEWIKLNINNKNISDGKLKEAFEVAMRMRNTLYRKEPD